MPTSKQKRGLAAPITTSELVHDVTNNVSAMSLNTTPSKQSAANTFANIPELVEIVIFNIDGTYERMMGSRTFATLRATCQSFRALIDHSPALRQSLYYVLNMNKDFGVLRHFANGWGYGYQPVQSDEAGLNVFYRLYVPELAFKYTLGEVDAKMFVSEPPITKLKFFTPLWHYDHDYDHTISVDTGITVGDLHDTVERFMEYRGKHNSLPAYSHNEGADSHFYFHFDIQDHRKVVLKS